MDYGNNSRIDLAYERVFDKSIELYKTSSLQTVCAIHYLLEKNDVFLSICDFSNPNYKYKLDQDNCVFSRALINDLFFNDLREAHYTFANDELEVIDALNTTLRKFSSKALKITKDDVAKAMAKYIWIKNTPEALLEPVQVFKTSNMSLNLTKQAIKDFEKNIQQSKQNHLETEMI